MLLISKDFQVRSFVTFLVNWNDVAKIMLTYKY